MLDNRGFDLWADHYDEMVQAPEENGSYPFAGYKTILNIIYNRILNSKAKKIMDIGLGTGTLATKLYEKGCSIYGQDFSEKMLEIAQTKMPKAILYQGDFSDGVVAPLTKEKYDAIVATYTLHHLTDEHKITLIRELLALLEDGGCLYIGDISFQTEGDLEICKNAVGDGWDFEEIYFVYDHLKDEFPNMHYEQISFCAGIMMFRK